MTPIDFLGLDAAIKRCRDGLQQHVDIVANGIPLCDLIEAEASFYFYSRQLSALARKAQRLKRAAKAQKKTSLAELSSLAETFQRAHEALSDQSTHHAAPSQAWVDDGSMDA